MAAARESRPTGRGLVWALGISLVIAVSVAISLAVQLNPEQASPQPPACGGLFSACCSDWVADSTEDLDRCDDDCPRPTPAPAGLFDAEANFADRRPVTRC